mmetsp:Transcript_11345/g.15720  ORF Transcript_11345/g.15720 Transcript_11345/m.15720 type:complete len:196 (-) Transcript_11345:195-782(-)
MIVIALVWLLAFGLQCSPPVLTQRLIKDPWKSFYLDAVIVSSLVSGVPSVSICLLMHSQQSLAVGLTHAINSLAAVGNALVPEDSSFGFLLLAGGVVHYLMCSTLSFVYLSIWSALAPPEREKKQYEFMALGTAGMILVHLINLHIVPTFWKMPLLDQLLIETTSWPHLCDHLMFGFSLTHFIVHQRYRLNKLKI